MPIAVQKEVSRGHSRRQWNLVPLVCVSKCEKCESESTTRSRKSTHATIVRTYAFGSCEVLE